MPDSLAIVQQTWQDRGASGWHESLANGIVSKTAASRIDVALRPDAANASLKPASVQPLNLLLRPDPHIWDGRFNNNAWLQELPRPLTKLTWDNPLLIAPDQAQRLGVRNGDRVTLSVGQTSVTLPAWIMPGQADNCVVGLLGFGRRVVGTVGEGTGFDLYPLSYRQGPLRLPRPGARKFWAAPSTTIRCWQRRRFRPPRHASTVPGGAALPRRQG